MDKYVYTRAHIFLCKNTECKKHSTKKHSNKKHSTFKTNLMVIPLLTGKGLKVSMLLRRVLYVKHVVMYETNQFHRAFSFPLPH